MATLALLVLLLLIPRGSSASLTRSDMADIIIQCNIFSPERRYEPASNPSGEPSPEEKEVERNIKLLGTVLYRTKGRALLRISPLYRSKFSIKGTDRRGCLWVEEGEELGPFKVKEVGDGFIVLERGTATYRIEISMGEEAGPGGRRRKRPPIPPPKPHLFRKR